MIEKKRVLYKKNRTFFIRQIVTSFEKLEEVLETVENGTYFAGISLEENEMVDIIDISYLQKDEAVHVILHFAIIKQG